jgi:hypothetical protein
MNRRLPGACAAGALIILLAPSPAPAATHRAASGATCTIVGTAKAETLRGTSGKDVICGRGGNDLLIGNGGNDVLDGGGGNDTMRGGGGNDSLYGGDGTDRLSGETGNDALVGGPGSDTLGGGDGNDTVSYAERVAAVTADLDGARDDGVAGEGDLVATDVENIIGGAGPDRLTGSSRWNRITGGDGADVLRGNGGSDTLSGGAGNDRINGGSTWDTISGGPGDDVLIGDTGPDNIYGDSGNDELEGSDSQVDTLDGGTGRNTCGGDGSDQLTRCVADAADPVILSGTLTPTTVDVTLADRALVARMRITDDTGVANVRVASYGVSGYGARFSDGWANLVSGTTRDGIWEVRGWAARYTPAGEYGLSVDVVDRAGRPVHRNFRAAIILADENPDTTPPAVGNVTLSKSTAVVGDASTKVKVTAHITDDLSGADQVELCAARPDGNGHYVFALSSCVPMRMSSGTTTNGVWTGEFTIAKGAPAGLWNVGVNVFDRAAYVDGTVAYLGEDWHTDYMAQNPSVPGVTPIAGGRLSVVH